MQQESARFADAVLGAYRREPERYLDPAVRQGMSVFVKAASTQITEGLARLDQDLRSGASAERHHELLGLAESALGYRLLIDP